MGAGKDQTRCLNSQCVCVCVSLWGFMVWFQASEVYGRGNVAMPTRSHGKKRIDKPAAKQPRKKDATVKQDLAALWIAVAVGLQSITGSQDP